MQRDAAHSSVPPATRGIRKLAVAASLALLASGCSMHSRHATAGKQGFREDGKASWYGPGFHGKTTANGEKYDMHGLTAAHKKLPFGTIVEVRNRDNGRSVLVRINDRGPFVRGRIIDLSRGAAEAIGMIGSGIAEVSLRVVSGPAPESGADTGHWLVQAGAFSERTHAEDHLRRVRLVEPRARLESRDGMHRVVIGPLDGRREAGRVVARLEGEGIAAFPRRSG